MTKLSNVVVSHAKNLLTISEDLKVKPKQDLSDRDLKLFWTYQGKFPQEFTKAIIDTLPPDYDFVSYNHLTNTLEVCPHV